MKKYAALIVIGVCLTGTVFFIVGAEKSSGNAVFQDSYNRLEEGVSASPQIMKNKSIGKAESDSVEETDTYVRIWTSEQLIDMERSNIQSRLARQYEIQQYKYEGEIPQDIKELSDEEGPMDRPDAYACLCAMEEFCGGTDYTVLEIKYTSIFGDWMVLFEKDGEQYVCADNSMEIRICDAAVWEEVVGNIEKSDALSQLAEQYAILHYVSGEEVETPHDVKAMPGLEEWKVQANGSLCAMEEFCGGTDYTVLAVKQAGFSWMVLFEKDDRQYVCAIGEVCTFFTICDMAVWEEMAADDEE